jgi:hypothetical protein
VRRRAALAAFDYSAGFARDFEQIDSTTF